MMLLNTELWRGRAIWNWATLACLSLLAACSALPEAGPSTHAVMQGGGVDNTPPGNSGYHFVQLTEQAAAALNREGAGAAARGTKGFVNLPPAGALGLIGPGDLLQISLWEPNPTGATLFTPPGLNLTLRVDRTGDLLLPYVGLLRAAQRTPLAVSQHIVEILQQQGHSIQAAAMNAGPNGDNVSLLGDVNRPGLYPITFRARDILSLVAQAGGAKQADYATILRLRRGNAVAEAPLSAIENESALNVACQPGDALLLEQRHWFFYAFGAVNRPGLVPYDGVAESLAHALADIAGLKDDLAAPRGVFIYRREPAAQAQPQTVYQLDMTLPDSFFVADQFTVRPDDVVYVSDAPIADVTKVLQSLTAASSIAVIPRNFGATY